MSTHMTLSRREIALGAALIGMTAAIPTQAKAADSVEAIKALIDSYQKAFSAHDMTALLSLFAPKALIIGTGPGEIWGTAAEIREAYQRFFDLFDKGKQTHESLFVDGQVVGDMAWLVSMSKMTFSKGTGKTEFGLNLSVVFEKIGGKWLVRTLHFSNLTSGTPAKS